MIKRRAGGLIPLECEKKNTRLYVKSRAAPSRQGSTKTELTTERNPPMHDPCKRHEPQRCDSLRSTANLTCVRACKPMHESMRVSRYSWQVSIQRPGAWAVSKSISDALVIVDLGSILMSRERLDFRSNSVELYRTKKAVGFEISVEACLLGLHPCMIEPKSACLRFAF